MRASSMRLVAGLLIVFLGAATARAAELVEGACFALPQQTQVIKYLVSGERVFASVRVDTRANVAGQGNGAPEYKSVLAAWDLKGKLVWQADFPLAYHLLFADGQLVMARDDGTVQAQRELIWIDPATGKVRRRAALDGRPGSVCYYPKADRIVVLLYPQKRLETLDGAWMEVAAYNQEGQRAWLWKIDATELDALRLDGEVLVVGSTFSKTPVVVRLDPGSGQEMWRTPWERKGTPDVPRELAVKEGALNLDHVIALPVDGAVEFLDLARGKVQVRYPWSFKLPEPSPHPMYRQYAIRGHSDRYYFTRWELEGITLAAAAFPSGKLLWAEETGTVSYRPPVAWGDRTVFLTRRLTGGLVGSVSLTELRIYDARGKLLTRQGKNYPDHWDDTVSAQAVGDRLYVVRNGQVVALKWVEN